MDPSAFLQTERLYLRPWRESDFEALRPIFTDPRVVRYTDGSPWTDDKLRGLVRWGMEHRSGTVPGFFNCPLIYREGDVVIGRAGINPLWYGPGNADQNEPETEWTLAAETWGKGLATEIGKAMIVYGFETAGFDHLIALAHPENAASLRVMQKIGMRYWKTEAFRGEEAVFYRLERS